MPVSPMLVRTMACIMKPNFRAIWLEIDGLDAWLCVSGIEIKFNDDYTGGRIEFSSPDPISFAVTDHTRGVFGFRSRWPTLFAGGNTTATVELPAAVQLVAEQPQPLAYFANEAGKLCNFLALALDQPVSIESIVAYEDERLDGRSDIPRPINIYGRFGLDVERRSPIERLAALFLYPSVKDELDQIMVNWFQSYEMFAPAINLYFAAEGARGRFLGYENSLADPSS